LHLVRSTQDSEGQSSDIVHLSNRRLQWCSKSQNAEWTLKTTIDVPGSTSTATVIETPICPSAPSPRRTECTQADRDSCGACDCGVAFADNLGRCIRGGYCTTCTTDAECSTRLGRSAVCINNNGCDGGTSCEILGDGDSCPALPAPTTTTTTVRLSRPPALRPHANIHRLHPLLHLRVQDAPKPSGISVATTRPASAQSLLPITRISASTLAYARSRNALQMQTAMTLMRPALCVRMTLVTAIV
jgi:hypothetical protein